MTLYETPRSKRYLRIPYGSPRCGRLVAIDGSKMPNLSGVCSWSGCAKTAGTQLPEAMATTAETIRYRTCNFIQRRRFRVAIQGHQHSRACCESVAIK